MAFVRQSYQMPTRSDVHSLMFLVYPVALVSAMNFLKSENRTYVGNENFPSGDSKIRSGRRIGKVDISTARE